MSVATPPHRMSKRAELMVFLAFVILISGIPWTAVILRGGDTSDPIVLTLYALGACGPTLAALGCRMLGMRSPRTASWSRIRRWAPAALFAGALPAITSAFIAPLFGGSTFNLQAGEQALAEQGGLAIFLLVYLVTGPLSEEFGWRGFVQPRLRRRLSPVLTSLVLGTIWALWHLPFFAMTGTWQSTLGTTETVFYLISMVPMSLVYWLVSEHLRGGVPAAVLMHWTGNMTLAIFPLTVPIVFGVYFVMWCILAAAVAILIRRGNIDGNGYVSV